jgi:hypothetical protein
MSETRRSFLSHVGTGVTVIGTGAAITIPVATAQSVGGPVKFQATRHEQDDWLDKIPGQHRLVFDTTQAASMGSAVQYGTNYYSANQSSYGLQNADLAVVIIARHQSTPFAYNEAMWAKYGDPISNFIDRTKEPSKTNTYGRQLTGMTGRGAHLAVCQLATRAIAGSIARSELSSCGGRHRCRGPCAGTRLRSRRPCLISSVGAAGVEPVAISEAVAHGERDSSRSHSSFGTRNGDSF